MSTLANIWTKVRRLTGRPSPQQITNDQISEYVDTFMLYDMPAQLQLNTNETTFTFMTEANVEEYDLSALTVAQGSSDVIALDLFTNIRQPAYVAGYQSYWTQNLQQYRRHYSQLAQIITTVVGDGSVGPYTLTFPNLPITQNSVTVGAVDDTNGVVNAVDSPTDRVEGTWLISNTSTALVGSINYITGAISVTFPNAIPSGNEITFTAVPYVASRPLAILYYGKSLFLRPIPDKSYKVEIEATIRPTQLLVAGDSPELEQWWEFIAYGASKKIFEDSQDPEGVNNIMAAFKEQERFVLRRTLIANSSVRTATIYTEMNQFPYGNQGGPLGGI